VLTKFQYHWSCFEGDKIAWTIGGLGVISHNDNKIALGFEEYNLVIHVGGYIWILVYNKKLKLGFKNT
jgi:hypothetical protein